MEEVLLMWKWASQKTFSEYVRIEVDWSHKVGVIKLIEYLKKRGIRYDVLRPYGLRCEDCQLRIRNYYSPQDYMKDYWE